MIDAIESGALLVALAIICGIWAVLEIRARRAAVDLERRVAAWKRMHDDGLCAMVWQVEADRWVVCARAFEHAGPHLDTSTMHLRR